uniref:Cyclin dependent kinase 2 interacting protein n=1 Tax=Leptobrachium leishanense TaxID=445787 RepID=A0A8C5QUM5_9ANUR
MENKNPAFTTPNKSQLTGSARKIKDNAADWHNLMLKWETFNNTGFDIASKIVNLKISSQNYSDMLLDGTISNKDNLENDKTELERCCTELLNTLENMEQIHQRMKKLSSTLKGVCDLEAYQCSHNSSKPVLFHTWPTTLFYETSLKMSNMYEKEVSLKQMIAGHIAHTIDQDLQMVYLSCWLYQPYVDNSVKVLLESMLLETGHRPL